MWSGFFCFYTFHFLRFRFFSLFICLCLVLLSADGAVAQLKKDTLSFSFSDSLKAYTVGFGNFSKYTEEDRQVNNLFQLHDYYPYLRFSPVRNDLGNIGSADHQVLYNSNRPFGFRFSEARGLYFQDVSQRRLLISDKAFSNVYYVNGVNAENQLKADFTRAFGQFLNVGFHFGRINSTGFYAKQLNKVTDLSVYSAFRSRDERYRGHFIFDWQDLDTEENGGIANDSVFEDNLISGRAFIPTKLTKASNRKVGFDIGLNHEFSLARIVGRDSVRYSRRFIPVLAHAFSIDRYSQMYKDVPISGGFYGQIFLDSLVTNDSTYLLGVNNLIQLKLLANDSSHRANSGSLRSLTAGIGHSYDQVNYDSIHNAIHNVFLDFAADGKILGTLNWWAGNRFMILGHNIADNRVEGGLSFQVKKMQMKADVFYHVYRPDYMMEHYVSNHFSISNSFAKTNHLSTGLTFRQDKLRLQVEFRYHLMQNLVLFGTDRLPFQSPDVNQLVVIRAKEHLAIRWFHVHVDAAVQFKLSGDDIRVPMALGRGIIYYQTSLFKRKLRLQLGFEANYATAYYANAYNPALSAFHLQNTKQVGNYPFMDVFLNLRIKTFQGFFKIEHWNAGLLGYRYYNAPGYPANDLGWKFGVRWAFLD